MSSFLSSPARTSIFLEKSTNDPAHPENLKRYATGTPMNEQSQMGVRSPPSGCPPEAFLQEGSDRRGGERSSIDGGSVDQRSLAMSMEFFDAEEALESASDISTQPDDSPGLKERLQNEIRLRVLAQEALAALQAERSELLGRLKNAEASRSNAAEVSRPDDAEVAGAQVAEVSKVEARRSESDEVRSREEASVCASDLDQCPGGEPAAKENEESSPPAEVGGEDTKPKEEQREPGMSPGTSDGSESRVQEPSENAEAPIDKESASPEGEDIGVGPSGEKAGGAELSLLREAVVRRDVEIARLKEKLDYWERVNEEYRVQREDAKEKKREARRRLRRTRDWTIGLLSASVGLCIIGGAVYGAYRYWQGAPLFSGLGVNGDTDTRRSSGTSTAALEEGAPSRASTD